jgi:hypothetical protein
MLRRQERDDAARRSLTPGGQIIVARDARSGSRRLGERFGRASLLVVFLVGSVVIVAIGLLARHLVYAPRSVPSTAATTAPLPTEAQRAALPSISSTEDAAEPPSDPIATTALTAAEGSASSGRIAPPSASLAAPSEAIPPPPPVQKKWPAPPNKRMPPVQPTDL